MMIEAQAGATFALAPFHEMNWKHGQCLKTHLDSDHRPVFSVMVEKRRSPIGLPLSARHFDQLNGSNQTVSRSVARFIERPDRVKSLQDETLKRLGRNPAMNDIVESLQNCQPGDRCCGSECGPCGRHYKIWVASQTLAYQQSGVLSKIVTVLIKEIPVGALSGVSLQLERDAFRRRLVRHGITACIGNLETAYKPERRTWVLHAHLLIFGSSASALEKLRESLPLPRAVDVGEIKNPVRQITYLFKFVTYYRHPSSPRPLPLPAEPLAEILRLRRRNSFADHLVLLGFQRRGAIMTGPAFECLLKRQGADVATW